MSWKAVLIISQVTKWRLPPLSGGVHSRKTNIFAHENRPGLKRKRLYSNHPFSGANCFFQGRYTPFQLAYPAYQMVTLPIYQWNLCFLQTEFFSFKLTPKTLLYLPKTSQIQPSKPQGFGGHLDSFRRPILVLVLVWPALLSTSLPEVNSVPGGQEVMEGKCRCEILLYWCYI